ncbi:hypothetical protein CY35_10G096800 [Sphagnum magellanicum]|nr:hypothetical protein CY35_10G096800 [Sphagnum magellanicum]
MLKSYSSLNMVAFAKILQKYDKVTCLFVAQSYMHHVKRAYVNSSEKVNELMEKVEVTIFTEHFTSGNLQKAIAALRPMQQTTSQGVTCLLGFSTWCSLTLIAASGIIRQVDGDYRSIDKLTYLQTIFPTFRHHLIS